MIYIRNSIRLNAYHVQTCILKGKIDDSYNKNNYKNYVFKLVAKIILFIS